MAWYVHALFPSLEIFSLAKVLTQMLMVVLSGLIIFFISGFILGGIFFLIKEKGEKIKTELKGNFIYSLAMIINSFVLYIIFFIPLFKLLQYALGNTFDYAKNNYVLSLRIFIAWFIPTIVNFGFSRFTVVRSLRAKGIESKELNNTYLKAWIITSLIFLLYLIISAYF